ncbi:hypothetical protein LDENG_00094390 [Lucifuga dentata]|nr:hypothetical protein LDENG_00094390 [Lucifuga dentata]
MTSLQSRNEQFNEQNYLRHLCKPCVVALLISQQPPLRWRHAKAAPLYLDFPPLPPQCEVISLLVPAIVAV